MTKFGIAASAGTILVVLFLLERWLPLRKSTRSLWRRLAVNLAVSVAALVTAGLVVQPAAAAVVGMNAAQFGILPTISAPLWLEVIVGFLLLDLSFYYWHRLNHQAPLLWRFHNVHHLDPDLDVSTAFRFHFGEIALSALFRVVQVTLIGMSIEAYLIYEFAFTTNTIFHHSNLRLPIAVERWLNLVLVTPRMHGIHHSQVQEETNSNYSVVLPWWDRLHRSLRLNVPQDAIKIGVPAYDQPEDNSLGNLLLHPFRAQRDYWKSSPPRSPEQSARSAVDDRNRLAE
ncbi:MAG: sterol desaturase family protein [Blastopirellula sp. JB062]